MTASVTRRARTAGRVKPPKRSSDASRPTIEDVARRARVSVGTVSNVLNGRGNVAALREARVRTAIEALAYVPNGLAQGLRRQASRVVGLCAPLTSSAYFAALLDAFEDIAASQGYELMQVLTRQEPQLELRRVRALLARKVEGIIIIPSARPAAAFDAIVESRVPAVVVDRVSEDDRFDYVTMDDDGAMRGVVRELVQRGHRRLLYVVRHPALITTRRRTAAFCATLRRTPGARAEVLVRDADDARFAQQLQGMLDRRDRPTAVIGSNSALMLALLKSLRHMPLSIPRDLSLVCFDAPDWADVLTPPLAVVRPPTTDLARIAWERLLRRVDDASLPTERIELPALLELRGSIGPPPRR